MADALHELHDDPENAKAWRLFHQIVTRFSMDTNSVAVVLERLTKELDADDLMELMARFSVFYDAVCPPQPNAAEET